ncbi:hypothetical protein Q9233_002999 [Columba guinea]|nr:hypothetical protein Q9233_002999 [Columba guinea]
MQHIIDNHPDMATALLAGEKLKELILPGQQDDKAGALAALLLQLKLELPFDRVVTIGTVLIPILLVTLVFTKNFAVDGSIFKCNWFSGVMELSAVVKVPREAGTG